jgi:hypothetical protein
MCIYVTRYPCGAVNHSRSTRTSQSVTQPRSCICSILRELPANEEHCDACFVSFICRRAVNTNNADGSDEGDARLKDESDVQGKQGKESRAQPRKRREHTGSPRTPKRRRRDANISTIFEDISNDLDLLNNDGEPGEGKEEGTGRANQN